jgi:outer membrane protein assembly factor BamB
MPFRRSLPLLVSVACASLPLVAAEIAPLEQWPAWRGPLANGIAPRADPPVEWSETKGVKWKVEVPGRGTSTPVVWGDTIYLLTALSAGTSTNATTTATGTAAAAATNGPSGGGREGNSRAMVEQPTDPQRFVVLALDRATGKIRWERTARTELPHEGHHKDHGYASASPSTDGEVLIVPFGSRGLYAYDLAGRLLWQKDYGRMRTRNSFGEASSPALEGDRVIVLKDHEGDDDFIVALDKRTGKELWRQARQEPTGWTTPYVVAHGDGGRRQVIVNGTRRVQSYDFETGELLWQAGGQTTNAIPMVVAGHGLAFAASGLRGSALYAIKLDGRGELTGTDAIAWSLKKATPYVPSPLLYDDLLYFYAGNNAQLSIFEAKTGAPLVDAERLEGMFGVYASPVAAAGRVYLVARDGGTWVLKHGRTIEVLAKNRLDENFDASPSLAGRELYLRGRQHLYCLAQP